MSRLNSLCLSCRWEGPRSETHKELPNEAPSFTDVCPRCKRDDIEVTIPEIVRRSKPV